MRTQLTAGFVQGLKPAATRQIFSDTVTANLRLIVHVTGRKVWVWHGKLEGKSKTLTLGTFPLMKLHDARMKVSALNEAKFQGDYAAFHRAFWGPEVVDEVVDERAHCTTDWLFDLYMSNEGSRRKSAAEKRRTYAREIQPAIGTKKIDDITLQDLGAILQAKMEAGYPIASNRIQALMSRMFRWAVTRGRAVSGLEIDPARNLVKLADETSRKRYLSDDEIGIFFEALGSVPEMFGEALAVILYTGMRRAEAFGLLWNEVDWERGAISINGARTKNGLDLVLGLPETVLALLEARHKRTGRYKFVWPADRSWTENWNGDEKEFVDTSMSMKGWGRHMNRLNEECQKLAAQDRQVFRRFTIHDLRRTLSSGMHGLMGPDDMPQIRSDIVERILNHRLGGVRGVYNRWGYYAEKKVALRIWADHLEAIKTGSD